MADLVVASGQVETVEDFGKGDEGAIKRWKTELNIARKGKHKLWRERYRKINARYRFERMNEESGELGEVSVSGFNVLWANIRTTAPAIYSQAPKVIVKRRHMDPSLEARAACIIIQRGLNYQMQLHGGQFHTMMKACRLDFQLGGKAMTQVRYEQDANYVASNDLAGPLRRMEVPNGIEAYPNVVNERLCFDYKHPDDVLYSAGRTWKEVEWVAYGSYMTRADVESAAVFGDRAKYAASKIPFKSRPNGMSDADAERPENGALMRARIWAIFSKKDRKIIYICEDWDEIIQTVGDPSSLEDFFPSPAPARDTVTNDTLEPVPAYTEYGPQANELDELTRRASGVLDNIRVAGVYDQAHQELKALLDGGYDNKLIAVSKWAEFAAKGGLEGAFDILPIKESAEALEILYRARLVAKQDTDQMSGVFDVMRGETNASETLGAQKLKTGFGDLRSSEPKEELARLARDTLAIGGELMAEHFSPAALWQMSDFGNWFKAQEFGLRGGQQAGPPPNAQGALPGAPQLMPGPSAGTSRPPMPGQPPMGMPGPAGPMGGGTPMPPQGALPAQAAGMPAPMANAQPSGLPTAQEVFLAAIKLLKDEKLRGFIITVETNSTVEPDAQVEQQKRTQFLQASAEFLKASTEIATMQPKLLPLLGQMLLFGVRGFDVGSELETAFETVIQELENDAANPQPAPPTPEEIKAKAEQQKMEMEARARQQEQQFAAQQMQAQMVADQQKMQREMEKMQMELQMMREKMEIERMQGQQKLQLKSQENELTAQANQQQAQLDAETAAQQAAHDQQAMAAKTEQQRQSGEIKLDQQRRAQEQKPKPTGESK